jgi:hypothetical protein
MFVTHAEKLGTDWSQSQFDQLKSLAQQKLPSLLNQSGAADRVVRHQNDTLAKEGIPISSELLQRRYVGIFDQRKTSFSYLVFREARVQAGGTPALSNETVAITTLLYAGNVLALTVVERGMTEQSATSARSRSLAWLDQFTSENKR